MMLLILMAFSLAFVVTHIGMSAEPYRSRMMDRLGERGFRGLYSVVSFITLGGAIWVFVGHRGMGPVLWQMPWYMAVAPMLLMLLAIPLLVFGFVQPSPTGMRPTSMEPRGVVRITRHPANMALALFGLAHVIGSGTLGNMSFFASFFIVGFFGAYHMDARKSRELGEKFAEFKKQTSVFPFAAIAAGKTKLNPDELNKPLLIVCLILWLGLIVFHGKLFGASLFQGAGYCIGG